jgi:hypothetical protein
VTAASKAIHAQAQIRAREEYIRLLIVTLEAYVTTALSRASIDFREMYIFLEKCCNESGYLLKMF